MQVYNPKEWFKAILHFHKSDTIRKLFPFILILIVYSIAVAYLELEYLKLSERSWLRNTTLVHSLLGFALSLLLVFRTNTAYDRWWEARRQWGLLTNHSRSLAYKMNAILPSEDIVNRSFFRKIIPFYANTLIGHLRSDYTTYMLDDDIPAEVKNVDFKKHGPIQVGALIFKKINTLYQEEKITGDQLIILNEEIKGFTDICGSCERIKNTPIPQSYSTFIKKFIVIYVATLPFGYVFSMGYYVTLAVPFIFYVLASLELIAESIEEPFGLDSDDLPIENIARNIKNHTSEILLP